MYAYIMGMDNNTLYSLLNNKPATLQDVNKSSSPKPTIMAKYDLSAFPIRYGDLEKNTVYLGTADGYLFSAKE
jgi:hypothetical protein